MTDRFGDCLLSCVRGRHLPSSRNQPNACIREGYTNVIKSVRTFTLVLLIAATLSAQRYPRSRGVANSTSPLPAYKGLTATFHGVLKELNKKEIVIQNDEEQTVSIRRGSKTRFFKDDKEIKPKDLETETLVTVDASEDNDLKPTALKVTVDPNQKPKEKPELVKR